MSYTIIILVWRKPDISPSTFKSHYETTHIPLIRSLTGPLFPTSHSRFYLARKTMEDSPKSDTSNAKHPPTVFVGTSKDFDYDVYCTLEFENVSAFEAFYTRTG